jgi:hypothetical protein
MPRELFFVKQIRIDIIHARSRASASVSSVRRPYLNRAVRIQTGLRLIRSGDDRKSVSGLCGRDARQWPPLSGLRPSDEIHATTPPAEKDRLS